MNAVLERLRGGLVCTQAALADLPAPRDPAPFRIREMDMTWPDDVAAWLEIHNDAFGRAWGTVDYTRAILGHPHIRVLHTFFVLAGDQPVGAASVGVYRANPAVGVGHYLGFRRDARRHGLAKALVLHRYHALAAHGISVAESQTYLRHPESLRIHFECGFRPKPRRDPWNNPDPAGPLARLVTRHELDRLYARWAEAGSGNGHGAPLGRPVAWSR